MVAAENLTFDRRGGNFVAQAVRHEKIIDSPARIVLSRTTAVMPPGVRVLNRRVQKSERVDEASVQQCGKFCALFVAETRALMISFGMFKVNRLMRDVEVTADNHGLDGVQLRQMFAENFFPTQTTFEPFEVVRIRDVSAYEKNFAQVERDNSTFSVKFRIADAERDFAGLDACENRRARVTFAFAEIPKLFVTVNVDNRLTGLHANFLHGENVRVDLAEAADKIFLQTGAQTVDVPRSKFHNNQLQNQNDPFPTNALRKQAALKQDVAVQLRVF